MRLYRPFVRGRVPAGSIVVRLYLSGGEVRGFIRETAADEADETIFPSEEMEPEVAFRLAENKLATPGGPIFIELTDGVEWDANWGRLEQ